MMDYKIKPIKSEQDYKSALEYLYGILEADDGTFEANNRDVLAILIEKYEEEHFPIAPPNPIDAIKFRMEQKGLSQKDLSSYIGSRSKVSEVLAGKRELTLKMIRALHTHLGIPADVLLQDKETPSIMEFSNIDFEKYPITEMAKNGAFKGFDITNLKDKSEEAIRYLVDRIGGTEAIPEGLFRKTTSARLNAKVDTYALQAWSLQVLSTACEYDVKKYIAANINKSFIKGLASLSILEKGPLLAREYLNNHGIILVIVPHLKNTYLDGAAFITKSGVPIIGLTLRYDRIDNFWFTLFHEIGHVVKHLTNRTFIVDDMTLRGASTDDSKETESDNFAEDALLPNDFDLDQEVFISKEQVLEYSISHSIHPAIVAGRIQHKQKNYRRFSNLIGRGEVEKCFRNE
jgi:HTH-type transcriptional regulator/antitoxin HigA